MFDLEFDCKEDKAEYKHIMGIWGYEALYLVQDTLFNPDTFARVCHMHEKVTYDALNHFVDCFELEYFMLECGDHLFYEIAQRLSWWDDDTRFGRSERRGRRYHLWCDDDKRFNSALNLWAFNAADLCDILFECINSLVNRYEDIDYLDDDDELIKYYGKELFNFDLWFADYYKKQADKDLIDFEQCLDESSDYQPKAANQ